MSAKQVVWATSETQVNAVHFYTAANTHLDVITSTQDLRTTQKLQRKNYVTTNEFQWA
jgi:hypothetical protein